MPSASACGKPQRPCRGQCSRTDPESSLAERRGVVAVVETPSFAQLSASWLPIHWKVFGLHGTIHRQPKKLAHTGMWKRAALLPVYGQQASMNGLRADTSLPWPCQDMYTAVPCTSLMSATTWHRDIVRLENTPGLALRSRDGRYPQFMWKTRAARR